MSSIASHGGRLLGDRLLTWSYLLSAGIFCYFAVYVIVSGYREFILASPALQAKFREAMNMNTAPIPPSRYEDGRALTLAGFAERFTLSELSGLPLLWQRFAAQVGHVPGQHGLDSYGVCHNPDAQGGFDYLAGVEVGAAQPLPEGFSTLTLTPQHYAVFEHRGSLQGLKATFDGIFHWLPQAGERQADAALFERYPAGFDPMDPQAVMEIWVPLERA
ncbi:GyrI-like domain-containing protein [Pseudomonas putida]